jgi:hypothetical protein
LTGKAALDTGKVCLGYRQMPSEHVAVHASVLEPTTANSKADITRFRRPFAKRTYWARAE